MENLAAVTFKPIGWIESPFTDTRDMPRFYSESGETTATLHVLPEFTDGLMGVTEGMELLVIFHINQSKDKALQVYKRGTGPLTGVFATRSPRRPNPIGVSTITVEEINGSDILFTGVDMLNGTPVLDIKSL